MEYQKGIEDQSNDCNSHKSFAYICADDGHYQQNQDNGDSETSLISVPDDEELKDKVDDSVINGRPSF